MKNIEDIMAYIERELEGQRAFVQIQVGNEYYARHIGEGKLAEHPRVMTEPSAPFLTWLEKAIGNALVSEGTRENHRNTLRHLNDI